MATGINQVHSQAVAHELTKILANETVLYLKTKNAYWNIEGADYYEKHKFLETQFKQLDDIIDKVAKRIRSIGYYTHATLKSHLNLTQLTEVNYERTDIHGFMKELLADHESIIIQLRNLIQSFAQDFHDSNTSDFTTSLMETHEKMAWKLRSHL